VSCVLLCRQAWCVESLLLSCRRHIASIAHLTDPERLDLASVLSRTTRKMDNLFACSFAYSMGVYQAPTFTGSSLGPDDASDAAFAQLHLAFYPPLLRSASVKKFLAGFELFAETARDITPEQAAEKLRKADGEVHWKAALAGPV